MSVAAFVADNGVATTITPTITTITTTTDLARGGLMASEEQNLVSILHTENTSNTINNSNDNNSNNNNNINNNNNNNKQLVGTTFSGLPLVPPTTSDPREILRTTSAITATTPETAAIAANIIPNTQNVSCLKGL